MNVVNDGETILYIEREYSSYYGNLTDIELSIYQRMEYHDRIELEQWEYLNKIPRGIFRR